MCGVGIAGKLRPESGWRPFSRWRRSLSELSLKRYVGRRWKYRQLYRSAVVEVAKWRRASP